MATGLGKTTVVAADIKRFLADKPDARVLFLCHQNDILEQAQATISQIVGDQYTYGNFTGEDKDYLEVSCLFASFQAMNNWREAFLPEEFDYVVVDESHHAKANTYEPTLNYFKPEFMLGVTATPDRHDLRNIREIFGEEIYRLSLEEALARNLLTPVDYHVITDEVVNTQVLRDTYGRRYNLAQLDRQIFAPKRDEEIVRLINEKAGALEGVKRIIFCKSIEQANQFASYFKGGAALHHDLPKSQQAQHINKFRLGSIDTLVTVDMFNEGIDIPDANQIVFLRGTESKTIFLQQLGRGLRRFPGKDFVQVLDFAANCDRLLMLNEMWQQVFSKVASGDLSDEEKQRIYINMGRVEFDEAARDILEILADLESVTYLSEVWTAERSVETFAQLYEELGYVPRLDELTVLLKKRHLVPLYALLKPFNSRYRDLRTAAGIEMPEGWMSLSAFAREVRAAPEYVLKLAAEHNLPIATFPFGSRPGGVHGFSPETRTFLREDTYLGTPSVPPGAMRVKDFARTYNLGEKRLYELRSSNDISIERYRGGKKVGDYIREEDQHKVLRMLPPEASKDILSLHQMTVGYPVTKKRALKLLQEQGVNVRTYRFGIGPDTEGLDVTQQAILQGILDKLPTPRKDDEIAIREIVEELRISRKFLSAILTKSGITIQSRSGPGGSTQVITTAEYNALIASPEFQLRVSNELVTVKSLQKELGLSDTGMNSLIAKHNIPITNVRMRGQEVRAVNRSAQEAIRTAVTARPRVAPPEYISLGQFAKKRHVAAKTIKTLADTAGITFEEMTFNGPTGLALNPEQQTAIDSLLNRKS